VPTTPRQRHEPSAAPASGSAPIPGPTPDDVERWLARLGLELGTRTEREGIAAWDVTLDGAIRRDLRVTVILDPSLGIIAWAHLAPPLGDNLRKAYRTLLGWNDDFPFAKFSIAEDGRPILAIELADRWLAGDGAGEDELGLALSRVSAIADRVFDACREWLWIGGRVPAGYAERPRRTEALRTRFAGRLGELVAPEPEAATPGTGTPGAGTPAS
jgi:hypothetical protein